MNFATRVMCCCILYAGAVWAQRAPVTEYVGRIRSVHKRSGQETLFQFAMVDSNGVEDPNRTMTVSVLQQELSRWTFRAYVPSYPSWVSVNFENVEKDLMGQFIKYRVLVNDYVITRELYLSNTLTALR